MRKKLILKEKAKEGRIQVRPPNMGLFRRHVRLLKVAEFRLWRDLRPPNLPPKVPCSAFLCMISMIVLRCFRGFLGSSLESCSCMFGPSFESTCVGSDPRNRGPQQ